MNVEPDREHLREVSQASPASLPARFLELNRSQQPTLDEEPPETQPLPIPLAPELTDSQISRVHLAQRHADELAETRFLDMSPADQVLWFNRVCRDNEELLRIIRSAIRGL